MVFLGPPGVGKTHLAIGPGIRTTERGRRVVSGPLGDLVGSLEGADTKGAVAAPARILTHRALLVVDESGYPPVTRNGVTLFFQLINERYERASTVLTRTRGSRSGGRSSEMR